MSDLLGRSKNLALAIGVAAGWLLALGVLLGGSSGYAVARDAIGSTPTARDFHEGCARAGAPSPRSPGRDGVRTAGAAGDVTKDGLIEVADIQSMGDGWRGACGEAWGPAGERAASRVDSGGLGESETATVSIMPVTSTVGSGERFSVAVVISRAVDLGAFEFEMAYSATVVHVDGVTLGAFLGSTGRSAMPAPGAPRIDNEGGTMRFGAFSFGTQAGPSGAGVLCTISMTAQARGTTRLELDEVQVLYPSGVGQDVWVEDGSVRVVEAGVVILPLIMKE